MDPEVIEIPPPTCPVLRMSKRKEIIIHDAIDIDIDEESDDVMIIEEKYNTSNKGKGIKNVSNGYSDHQWQEDLAYVCPEVQFLGSMNLGDSKSHTPASNNLMNLEGHNSNLSYYDDEYISLFHDEYNYSFLQAHFDHADIPPGIEATIPWMPNPNDNTDKQAIENTDFSADYIQPEAVGVHKIDSHSISWPPKPAHLQAQMNAVNPPPGIDASVSWLPSQDAKGKKKTSASQFRENTVVSENRGSSFNFLPGVGPSKPRWFLDPYIIRKKQITSNVSAVTELDAMLPHPVAEPSWGHNISGSGNKYHGTSNTHYSNTPAYMDALNHPPGVGQSVPWWAESFKPQKPSLINHGIPPEFYIPLAPIHVPLQEVSDMAHVQDSSQNRKYVASVSSLTASSASRKELDEILRNFKQFDTVEDHSDHHYTRHGSSLKQPLKAWAKRIQEEWKILEKDLPDTIFVRVYETRMDLLRAVIVGAEGTPYHDGLFFFDVFFPSSYPTGPPHVYYHSGGLRLNPNLYNCGKVCLSLLNTWSGSQNEKWIPTVSTMLQVLVSIQGLILNTKPYFNEPGYAHMSGSAAGETRSQQYNEETFMLSLRTMLYTMRRPPKHFEDFVMGHFRKRAHDILVACKAYMDGAQVGCLVKGGIQDVDMGDKSCSKQFKESLASVVNMIIKEFTNIGVKD